MSSKQPSSHRLPTGSSARGSSGPGEPRAEPLAPSSIDPAALAQVTGGAGSNGSADPAVMTALTGILDSLKELSSARNNGGGFSAQDLMLIMMMMRGPQQPVTVVRQPAALPPTICPGPGTFNW